MVAYFKEVVLLHLPRLVLSGLCLRTSNDLSLGEFDKCLKCIRVIFAAFLGKSICFMW